MVLIFENVFILFFLIFLGFFAGKRKIINNNITGELSAILIKITVPCTVLFSMMRPYDKVLMKTAIYTAIIMTIFFLLAIFIGNIICKVLKIKDKDKGVWIFVTAFSNNGFIGFPLAYSLYGNDGLFLMAIINVVSNFLMFSLGIKLLTMNYEIKNKIDLKKMLINNLNIVVVFGILIYSLQIKLPGTFSRIIEYLANVTVPLSMIVVGLSISKLHIRDMIKDFSVYTLAFIRLILITSIIIILYRFINIFIDIREYKSILNVIVLTSMLPAPSMVSIISEEYKTNVSLAGKTIFITTLFSLATIPFMLLIYNLFT